MTNTLLNRPARVRSYRTTDGRLFDDYDDAACHQAVLSLATYCRNHGLEAGDFIHSETMEVHGRALADLLSPFRLRRARTRT